MKTKVILLIITVGIISAAIITIPHALSVRDANRNWTAVSHDINNVESHLTSTGGIDDCVQGFHKIPSYMDTLDRAEQALATLDAASFFPRTLVAHLNYQPSDIQHARHQLDATFPAIPQTLAVAIHRDATRIISQLAPLPTLEELRRDTLEFAALLAQIQPVVVALLTRARQQPAMYASAADIDVSALQTSRKDTRGVADAAVASFARVLEQQRVNYRTTVEACADARAAIEAAQNHTHWLKQAHETLSIATRLGSTPRTTRNVNATLDAAVNETKADAELIARISTAQKAATERMNDTLRMLDDANTSLQHLAAYASSQDIQRVYMQWNQANDSAITALNALNVHTANQHQTAIAERLQMKPRTNIRDIQGGIAAHQQTLYAQLQEARRQEASALGSTQRSVKRSLAGLADKLAGTARDAQASRMGREVGIATRMLILGTKAFYDLLDPRTDPMTWAFAYSADIDGLLQETQTVMAMEGPSLTGKNTVVEDLVNGAYAASFDATGR